MNSKKCPKCGNTKMTSEFYKNNNPDSKTGLASWCKSCTNQYTKSKYTLKSKKSRAKKTKDENQEILNKHARLLAYLKSIKMSHDEYLGQPIYRQEKIDDIAETIYRKVITETLTDGTVIRIITNEPPKIDE